MTFAIKLAFIQNFEKIRFQPKMMFKKKCKVNKFTLCDLHNVSI